MHDKRNYSRNHSGGIWSLAEVAAFFGMFPEYWQAPADHPLVMLLMLVLFVGGIAMLLRGNRAAAD
jgi:hypothetical protein